MPLFKRSGEPIKIPDSPDQHVQTLNERKATAGLRLAELIAQVDQLADEHATALLEGRFSDAEAAAEQLEAARAELPRAEAAHTALEAAEVAVAKERQLLDWQSRLVELQALQDEIGDRIQRKVAELPLLVEAAQTLAADLLAEEAAYRSAAAEAHQLRNQITHFGESTIPVAPRVGLPSPLGPVFAKHPEYRMLANRNWFLGVAGGSR